MHFRHFLAIHFILSEHPIWLPQLTVLKVMAMAMAKAMAAIIITIVMRSIQPISSNFFSIPHVTSNVPVSIATSKTSNFQITLYVKILHVDLVLVH